MVTVSVSLTAFCLTFITVSLAEPSQEACEILEVSPTAASATEGKLIRVGCGEKTVIVDLLEGGSNSTLKVIGEHGRNLLTVNYFKESNDMFIVIDGEQFDVKDEKIKEEAKKFGQLMDDPEFASFAEAAKLIHDELELKGWESPASMFLYRIGMASQDYRMNKYGAAARFFVMGDHVDPDIYNYHGPDATKQCTYTGKKKKNTDDLNKFIDAGCRGLCGPTCDCWQWVCGGCCIHNGCTTHDDYCKHYWYPNCMTGRGVLWDTKTGVYRDC